MRRVLADGVALCNARLLDGRLGAQSSGTGIQGRDWASQRVGGGGLIDASDQLIGGKQAGRGQVCAAARIHFRELGAGREGEDQEKGARHAAEHNARLVQVQCAGVAASAQV
ncbi:MAG: hypothetical protein U1A24_02070 [Cypionkella sp.]|uniref:hypothetical protein n=1 Tax=Cypionkella sp. TaxID=2811411 RepID=UPI002AB96A18|nr:hypothetical protein [Cypionkella sp.]MDZ4309335.1 hypothetical protein [Cypionkella sp.]MDZ4395297.1 hypothetical protein [Cypionkella sp.]